MRQIAQPGAQEFTGDRRAGQRIRPVQRLAQITTDDFRGGLQLAPAGRAEAADLADLLLSLEAKFWERGPRQLLIFFSDGVETGSEDTKEEESLEVARRSGVLTYVIQYDPRPHYLRLHRGAMYDPTWEPPPGTTGTSVGGIFVGSGRPSRTDRAGYMVGRMFDRAVQYLRKVAESGRGEYHMMLEPSDLASIYRRILTDLEHLSTVTIDPTPGQGIQGVTIETTRPGVTAQLLTKGFWPH